MLHNIPRAFFDVFMIALFLMIGFGIVSAVAERSHAMDYKASVIAEIENSNFNDSVIADCIKQAKQSGYELKVNKIVTDEAENKQIAEVVLNYKFTIGILKIQDICTTRGFAR